MSRSLTLTVARQEAYGKALDALDKTKKQRKAAQEALYKLVHARFATLTEGEVKDLLVADKWLDTVQDRITSEVMQVAQSLSNRVRILADRYATPMPELEKNLDNLSALMATHLKAMGAIWQ